ncbi:MAG: ATP-binding cassette domain-containing protein [Chitinivibrionales bacterium]|nr:ATP-binding cassette domain-containing protein [Chitinivibrionales bacterium]
MNAGIHVESLSFAYGRDTILRDLSLVVQRGEKLGLVGPNGGGKTTFFYLLCGMLKPDSGRISLNDVTIHPHAFNPSVAYLFQSPDDQLFSATVFDDVAFGPLNMKLTKEEVVARSRAALRDVNCPDIAAKAPHHLSGGEKRLVALASLLSMDPEVLLLDEPTSNLDMRNRRKVIDALNRLDRTMIISSHDLEFLLETCTAAAILDQHTIVARNEIRKLFANRPLMELHHLEKPHSLIPHTHNNHISGHPSSH